MNGLNYWNNNAHFMYMDKVIIKLIDSSNATLQTYYLTEMTLCLHDLKIQVLKKSFNLHGVMCTVLL